MSLTEAYPLIAFVFFSSITPGPNNLMLLASGMSFGVRKSAGHIIGILIGVYSLIVASGLGVLTLLTRFPGLQLIMSLVAMAYLLYLAYRIATKNVAVSSAITKIKKARQFEPSEQHCSSVYVGCGCASAPANVGSKRIDRPMNVFEATAFQWINPKAWLTSMATVALFMANEPWYGFFIGGGWVVLTCVPCALFWTILGTNMSVLIKPAYWSWFNRILALLLVATIIPMVTSLDISALNQLLT